MADSIFVNMQLPKQKKVSDRPVEEVPTRPRYPYGLEVTLDTASLKKLGYSAEDFAVGGKVHISALCSVISVRSSDRLGNESPDESVDLQITDLRLINSEKLKVTRKQALRKTK